MELKYKETNGQHKDFLSLIQLLDGDLSARYGKLQEQYKKFNLVDTISDALILYADDIPFGCGAFKKIDDKTVELKRIFIREEYRNKGYGKLILQKLENLARKSNYQYAILETGVKQQEAIHLYQQSGYQIIENYEPYCGNSNSICMRKTL